ncbi:hypothetical protein R3P38DRAFT_868834 [Favolaschia claudopus]|uniref:Uncharacterized protein n=1 Tax=Favolaschia claudopus TaxID=2862362 RepID=A0AAW0BVQ5_9AGAR
MNLMDCSASDQSIVFEKLALYSKALHIFDLSRFTSISPKHTTWPTAVRDEPTPTYPARVIATISTVAISCSLLTIIGVLSLTVLLLTWRPRTPKPHPAPAALSEATVLRIYDLASRQPYPMPPDDDGDPDTIPVLPFARNPRKQSLFLFWLLFLLIAGAVAHVLAPLWQPALTTYIVEKHATLSWTFTFFLSAILVNISGQFLQFIFALIPITKGFIEWVTWTVFVMAIQPSVTAYSTYMYVRRATEYLSRWYFAIPLDQIMPERTGRSAAIVSSAFSAVGGYRLASSRVARNYALVLKSMVQGPLDLFNVYVSLKDVPIFPTSHFQTWARWSMAHVLRFTLGELTWTTVSYRKLFVLVFPSLVICAYHIYKYNQVIVPPRSALQVAFDRLHSRLYKHEIASQRRDVEVAEIKLLLKGLDAKFTNFSTMGRSAGSAEEMAPSPPSD